MMSTSLKRKLKALQPQLSESHAIRLHRAISWLRAAEDQEKSPDLRLICLWVSVNSLYAMDETRFEKMQERERFGDFVDRLLTCDGESRLYNILWNKFSGPVRLLIENKYVYGPFWDNLRGEGRNWEKGFQQSIVDANLALSKKKVSYLLRIVLDRLYVLRNQLVHGGATYKSQVNRAQVRDGGNLLSALLPVMIELIMVNGEEDWGRIYFPVVR
jgi:hypothetical protein